MQFVLQPESSDPEAGEEARLTAVPLAKLAVHDVPQLMLAGLLATLPSPLPASRTDKMWDVAVAPASTTVVLRLSEFVT